MNRSAFYVEPSAPSSVNHMVSNTSIVITFAMPPAGTLIMVQGNSYQSMVAPQTSTETMVEFTDIVLGQAYNFTLVAIDSYNIRSAATSITNVTGKYCIAKCRLGTLNFLRWLPRSVFDNYN